MVAELITTITNVKQLIKVINAKVVVQGALQ